MAHNPWLLSQWKLSNFSINDPVFKKNKWTCYNHNQLSACFISGFWAWVHGFWGRCKLCLDTGLHLVRFRKFKGHSCVGNFTRVSYCCVRRISEWVFFIRPFFFEGKFQDRWKTLIVATVNYEQGCHKSKKYKSFLRVEICPPLQFLCNWRIVPVGKYNGALYKLSSGQPPAVLRRFGDMLRENSMTKTGQWQNAVLSHISEYTSFKRFH